MRSVRVAMVLATLVTLMCLAAPAQAAIPRPIPPGCLRLSGWSYSSSSTGVGMSVQAWAAPPNHPPDRVDVGDVTLRRDRFGLHLTSVTVEPGMAALGYEASILRADAPVGDWVHVLFASEQSVTDYHFVVKRMSATGGGLSATTATCW